jgi:predicted nucleic acid-binding protein
MSLARYITNRCSVSDTLSKFATLLTLKVGRVPTQQAVAELVCSYMLITHEPHDNLEAVQLYQKQTSKENSLFDCSVMIAAQVRAVDCIFSFDGGYKQNGFTLIEEYLQRTNLA